MNRSRRVLAVLWACRYAGLECWNIKRARPLSALDKAMRTLKPLP